jgi:hypothetical protein
MKGTPLELVMAIVLALAFLGRLRGLLLLCGLLLVRLELSILRVHLYLSLCQIGIQKDPAKIPLASVSALELSEVFYPYGVRKLPCACVAWF